MSIFAWLVVGLIAGWLAGVVVKGGGFGLIGDIIVGVVGAFIGGWLGQTMGFATQTSGINLPTIGTAFLGAVVLLAILKMVKRA